MFINETYKPCLFLFLGLPNGFEDTALLRRACRIVGTPPPTVSYTGLFLLNLNIFWLFLQQNLMRFKHKNAIKITNYIFSRQYVNF